MSSVVRIRASSWSSLFDCAMRWEGSNILGLKMPSSPRAMLGTAVHAGTAAFDGARISQKPITIDDAAGAFVDELNNPEIDVNWKLDDSMSKRQAEQIGLSLVSKYCGEVSPHYDFHAVELAIEPMNIDCGNGVVIQLTGTLDRTRIRKSTGGIGISDLKTGRNAVADGMAKTKGHSAQLGTYELLAENTLQIPITEPGEIIGLKTSGKPEIATGIIQNPRLVMLGDESQPGLIEHAAVMLKTGLFPPNPQSWCCSEKYCPRWNTCIFKN